jgi:uncharacterized protein
MRIWIDLTNSPHTLVFAPLIERIRGRGWDVTVTARPLAQTVELLEARGIEHVVIGEHGGSSRAGKARAAAGRVSQMIRFGRGRGFDAGLAHGSTDLPMACRALRVPNTTMFDYEFALLQHSLNCRLANRVLVPDVIPPERLRRYGARPPKLVQYPGLKEEYYLADLVPDPGVRAAVGARSDQVLAVLRFPADFALYHRFENTLFDDVLRAVGTREDVAAVVLPRTQAQTEHVRGLGLPSLHVAEQVVDGPSLLATADVVISAGGTMNREAAVLGAPVYTVFAGRIGAVDERLIAEGRLRQLTSADEIELVRRPEAAREWRRRDPDRLLDMALVGLT